MLTYDWQLVVTVEPQPHQWEWTPAETTQTTVNGIPATLLTRPATAEDAAFVGLTWPQDGQWIAAESLTGAVDAAEMVRFAESITTGTTATVVSGTTAEVASVLVPEGFAIMRWDDYAVCYFPPALTRPPYNGLCIWIWPPGTYVVFDNMRGTPLTVDGFPAEATDDELAVQLPDGHIVNIVLSDDTGTMHFTLDEFIAMFRGVTFR
jgi:hypothetical protein